MTSEKKVAKESITTFDLPLENDENIRFEDLFDLNDIQRLQDDFSAATGVASIITQIDGRPITGPSNFCRLCQNIIRKTERGYANCCKSDAVLGNLRAEGPRVQPCLSGGLWDAGAGISVGGRHIANWLIGQVRDETQTDEKMLEYAREIGADEQAFLEAFKEVPAMSREKFDKAAKALYTLAKQLSTLAYQNLQQTRFISQRQLIEEALRNANKNLQQKVEGRTQELQATNEELIAQNEEMMSMNEEIASLNQRLTGVNEELEQRVAERTSDLLGVHQELIAQFDELKQAQEALLQEKTFTEALFESIPGYLYVYDSQGTLIRWNKKHEVMTGYSAEELSHMTLAKWFEGEDAVRVAAAVEDVFITGYGEVEAHLLIKGGKKLHIRSNGVRLDIGGKTYFTGVGIDITEQVRRQEEIYNDARLATRVQNAMLPVPEASDYLQISTVFKSFGYVGGDLYFLDWRYGGSLLRGFLVDATGHGLGTALHTASLHVLLREVNERDLPLSETMRWLNRRAGQYFDEGTFAGALGFEVDLQSRQLRWSCAGIPKIWVATKAQQGVVECPGMSLGISADETFDTHTIPIDVGDSIYFMTDGMADLAGGRLKLPLNRYEEMVERLRILSESKERRDDTTAVCIHVRALPQSMVRLDGWPRILRLNGYGDYQRLKGEVGKILAEVTGKQHSLNEVAVHEALANAMECRDGVPRQHKARIRFNKIGKRIIVRVKTSRIGFAGNAILQRLRSHPEEMFSFGEDASMGRGIPIMLSMAHKMMYNSEGTEVLLAWKLE